MARRLRRPWRKAYNFFDTQSDGLRRKAVQLYSINKLCERDLEQGLEAVSEMGYDGVEFAGFFENDAKTVAGWLQKYNLLVEGAHIAPELVFDDVQATIDYHKAIGNTRIIVPWYDIKTKADVLELIEKFKKVAPIYLENGMTLQYHNHAHEFVKQDGEYFIDTLANGTSSKELMLQFDLYWIYTSNEDPLAYLEKYASRIDTFHAKDGNSTSGTPVGQGDIDYAKALATAAKLGLSWLVVECEGDIDEQSQLEQIKQSIDYINTIYKN